MAPATGARGRLNVPMPLAASPDALWARGSSALGEFEVVEVRYDGTSWTCEWPARVCRIRMVNSGQEGWIVLPGGIGPTWYHERRL